MLMLSELSANSSGRRAHNRRVHPRAEVGWPVTVISYKATYQGKTVNISRGGVLINLAHHLEMGENVRLAIEIPECLDAILAKAEVVRVFPLKRGVEQKFTHGIAFKFTEISEENLKYFTGNLAQEWKEDFSKVDHSPPSEPIRQIEPPENGEKHRHYPLWMFAFILLIPICYLFFKFGEQKADNHLMTTMLDKRLTIIEKQIESVEYDNDMLGHLAEKLNDLEIDLSSLRTNLPSASALESISLELQHQSHLVQQISDKVETTQKPSMDDSKVESGQEQSMVDSKVETGQEQSMVDSNSEQLRDQEQYYVVERGDTLYQISLKTGITIGELRIINSLDSNDRIIPGQKLIIK